MPIALITGAAAVRVRRLPGKLAAIGVEVVIGARDPQAAATAAGKLEGVRSYPAGLDIAS